MAIAPFLAMTAAEMYAASSLPPKIAWMACHFSPYGLGLSNLPKGLPPGALLMVDDITPPHGHDPQLIAQQLLACMERLGYCGVLLDFQRQKCEEAQAIAAYLSQTLPCPIAVSACYAGDLSCAVFLPPVPPSVPLEEHLQPWKDREIWMELGTDGESITLTEEGAEICSIPYPNTELTVFCEDTLCCHYAVRTNEKSARFTLWRTKDDLEKLLEKADQLGVSKAVALFQEWNRS